MSENAASSAPAARVIGRPFERGRSGNPNGLSKMHRDVAALARAQGSAAIAVLTNALKSRNERVRIVAAGMLLDRGFGKPTQPLTSADGEPLMLQHLLAVQGLGELLVAELARRQEAGTVIAGQVMTTTVPEAATDLATPAKE